jgi:hypothetical protein
MNAHKNAWLEGYVKALSEEKYSYILIKKRCEDHGYKISKCKISHIINNKGKKRESIALGKEITPNAYPRKVVTKGLISKVKAQVLKENPPTQRSLASALGTSSRTINKIINKDLGLKKTKKYNVHRLLPRHIAERRTNCRKLYEKHLSGEKWKFVVTLDEAWIYLSDCGKKRGIFYKKRTEKSTENWFKESREGFPKGFMVVAGFSYNGKLTIRKIEKNAKINSKYFQDKILTPIFEKDIPSLYPMDLDKVELHQDKASSHTSKSTALFLEKMRNETGIKAIPFGHIPVKSPDASPMDFCAFGLLKQALSKRKPKTLDGLWKVVEDEWSKLSIVTLRKSLLSWKIRCRSIVQNKGYQIEHLKYNNYGLNK